MTDKDKIRAEIEKLKEWQPIATCSLNRLEIFINSLTEEPVKIDIQVSKMADEFAEREYETDGYEREWLSKGYYHGYMDGIKSKPEEPVSKELEAEAENYETKAGIPYPSGRG